MKYESDVVRLVAIAAKHGFMLDPLRAEAIWIAHSNTYAAGWLIMSEETDEDLWSIIQDNVWRV